MSSAIADATIVNGSGTHQVWLPGGFADADGDDLTITAASSDETVATMLVASDRSKLTVTANSRSTATITVTADDGDDGTVEDAFAVTVKAAPVAASAIADVSGQEAETAQGASLSGVFIGADGGSRTLLADAEDTATVTVTAQDADKGWKYWVPVAKALREIETG